MNQSMCKWCKWYKLDGTWFAICENPEDDWQGAECVECIGSESERCIDHEE